MKVKSKLAVGAAALLLVGVLGVPAIHSFAQTAQRPTQGQTTPAPDNKQAASADTDQAVQRVGVQSAADTAAERSEAADEHDAVPTEKPSITADQAKATAEAHLNAGTATKVELDAEDGKWVYSVEIGTSEVKVDGMTGEVLGVEAADEHDAVPAEKPSITADQAKATAEAHLNAGTATKVELAAEDGKWVYSVEIGTSEVKVDGMTGKVLGVEAADEHDAVPAEKPSITADQAKATAEAHLNAGTATKVELDAEDGKWVYSVEIGTSEVKVDGMTGKVLGVDSDQA